MPSQLETGVARDIEHFFAQVAADLVQGDSRSSEEREAGLIFPKYRDGTLRVSEQEAKTLFLHRVLSASMYRVSVEEPTFGNYCFSGGGSRSAQTDVVLYRSGHHAEVLVEFKADNRDKGICKDLQKLVREEHLSAWFHTLASADRGTLPSIADKFITSPRVNTISPRLTAARLSLCVLRCAQ